MRFRLALLVAVTSVLTVASPVSAGPSHTATIDWAFVHREVFEVPLARFVADARTGDPWYDWTSDGCSAPLLGDKGAGYNFRDACRRHDFGYRNLHLLERRYGTGRTYWNAADRLAIDRQFLADMRSSCAHRFVLVRPFCLIWANVYYHAVRWFGGP